MPYQFKKGGGVNETGMKNIPLELSKQNLKSLLAGFILGESRYSHQDFANWCRVHFANIFSKDLDLKEIGIDEPTYEVLMDVDTQWDLFLVNTFKIEELQTLDLSTVKLPLEWFRDWLKQLEN